MIGRVITRLAAGAFALSGLVLLVTAMLRPYADNQRNWLVLLGAACLAVAVLFGVAASRAMRRRGARARLRAGARRLASEWRSR
jgi:hypothetical protein